MRIFLIMREINLMEEMLLSFPWFVILVLLPLVGGIACFVFPARAKVLGPFSLVTNTLCIVILAWQIIENGVYRHAVGGWEDSLAIVLHADGLSLLMLALTS